MQRRAPTPGSTTPIWAAKAPSYPQLTEDQNTEVCVVGAGIAGLTTAYLLCLEGKKVIVLEDGTIGSGETGRTTAHISNAFDDRYTEMESLHGLEGAKIIAESHTAAIEKIAAVCKHENIECEFRYVNGYLFAPHGQPGDLLKKEIEAAHRAGLADVQPVLRAPIDFDTGPALQFPRQAAFHPLKYLNGLAQAITRMGGRIYTGTHVSGIHEGTLVRLETARGKKVWADAAVIATNSPINTWVKVHSKQAPYRTFVIAIHVPKGSVPDALYWDTAEPYHYVRLQHVTKRGSKHDLLIVGGEDHKTGQEDDAEERFKRLEHWARDRFKHLGKVEYRWSGQVMEPVDGVAYIGRSPGGSRNIFMITGDSGNGITHGTLGGMLVTDLVLERENRWEKLYDPSRVNLHFGAALEYAKENINVAAQYTDYVTGGDVDSTREIKRGEGAVMQRGMHKLAMYRDEEGTLHERSAVCTHLSCVVHWNTAEKSWDCPCHGSRFAPTGEVLNGPASAPLGTIDEEKEAERGKASAPA